MVVERTTLHSLNIPYIQSRYKSWWTSISSGMNHIGRAQWQVGWNFEQPDRVNCPSPWLEDTGWLLNLTDNPNHPLILGSDPLDNWEQQFPFVTLLICRNVSDNIFASQYWIYGSGSITSTGGNIAWNPFLRLAEILLQEYPEASIIQPCLSCCTLCWSCSFTSGQGKVSKQNETCYKETHSKEWKKT